MSRSSNNQPIYRNTLHRIKEFMIRKGLKTGDKLPTEGEFAEQLKVSRTVIREAFTALKVLGIIRSKKGVGAIITGDLKMLALIDYLLGDSFDESTFKTVNLFRKIMELGMCDLLLRNVNEQHIAALEKLETMISLGEDSPITNLEFELRFHETLANITENELIILFSKIYEPISRYYMDNFLIKERKNPKKFVSHQKVIDALRERSYQKLYDYFKMK